MLANWTLFVTLYNGMFLPLFTTLNGMLGNMVATARPIALAMIALWMAIVGLDLANGTKSFDQVKREFFLAALAAGTLLSVAVYDQWVADFFLQALPNTISQALGIAGQTPAAALDGVLNLAGAAATRVSEAIPNASWKAVVELGIGVIVYCVIMLAAVALTFAIFVAASALNVIAILIGPIFIACAASPHTRRYAAGWLGIVVSGVIVQFLALVLILYMAKAETLTIQTTVQSISTAGGTGDVISMIWGLAECAMLASICLYIIKQVPAMASAIAGGVHHNVVAISNHAFGAPRAAAQTTVRAAALGAVGAAAGGRAMGNALGLRSAANTNTTGPSLSRAPTNPGNPKLPNFPQQGGLNAGAQSAMNWANRNYHHPTTTP